MSKFSFTPTKVPDVLLVQPTVFGDARGYFMETFHQEEFAAAGISLPFVQDNLSKSGQGVLRGLHFQTQNTQGKLVNVLEGCVFDVALDVRPTSPSFGQWAAAQLSSENRQMLYVPPGFAHGFLVMSESAVFSYKCTDVYAPAYEGGVRWDDADVDIRWPDVGVPFLLSEKDKQLPSFKDQNFDCFEGWVSLA